MFRSTLRPRPQPFATVRNRPHNRSATVRTRSVWPCLWEVLQRWPFLEVSDVSLSCVLAWQAWLFVTFRRVLQRVENRFAWQAQYFCDFFRRCVAVFVAGAALWACPSSLFRGRRSTLDVSYLCVFCKSHLARAASSGDKVQIPWQAWHFLTCVEN